MAEQMMENFLIKRAFLTPDRIAMIYNGKKYTFAQVYEEAMFIAGKLVGIGLSKGDYGAVLLRNSAETAFLLLALQLMDVKAVILNNRLTTSELLWQIEDAGAKLLISEDAFSETNDEIAALANGLHIFTREHLSELPDKEPFIQREVDLSAVCTIMYTSGTTGHPKGVMQSYGNHWWSAVGSALNLGLSEKDSWLCAVPMFHISGYSILMRSVIYGMTVYIMDRFDVKKVLQAIAYDGVTIMSVVSTMLVNIVEALGNDRLPSHFRCMLLGGGPAAKILLERCKVKGIPVFQTYGMTETSSQVATLSPEDSLRKLGSAGKPLFPAQLNIVRENGDFASVNEAGEIAVKGLNVTVGYLNRPEATAAAIQEGWLHTGDIGYLDDDGFLFVLDRRSDLIISGGENVYPAEIEGVLLSHPAIADAGVIGMKDAKWGEIPAAFIVTADNTISDQEISDFCETKLAKYKVPKHFIRIENIPRNASKKIMRRKLRELMHL